MALIRFNKIMENEGTVMTTEQITGRCLSMCPEKERLTREREGLLHRYEIDEGTKHTKRPKADPVKIVKCFSRSAAGQVMTDPNLLRPPHVLLSTVQYLFTKIITRTDLDWVLIYNFVFDRLRSVRQDAVIQRVDIVTSIFLLEPIVRFHIYAAQRKSPAIQLATKISFAWYLRNYVCVRHLVDQLSPILACAFFCNLQSFRRNVLQIMSSGYNSRVLTFPGLKLQKLLFYKDISKIQADCKLFGLTFTNENVLFKKSQFNEQILLANPEMYYTSTTLHKFMPKIFLECTSNNEC
ncbi:uncharacterized protein [Mycetomoellerius zeteki]|uniref:uncharacterized protein isoform X3 n=1 Tax=Mycetomoellerius zeteki TaxID=64791 RepID=UPI00084EC0CD|nr:PREDICTED: uncharacterized protein LOC108732056 isoform X3 [Trachymyrmex zeteki]